MEDSLEMIIIAFGVFMFCTGVAFFMKQDDGINRMIDYQKQIIYSDRVMY